MEQLQQTIVDLCQIDWIRMSSSPYSSLPSNRPLSLVDLFCGCGGLSLGVFEAARQYGRSVSIKLAVDIALDALTVYRENLDVGPSVAVQRDIFSMFPGDPGMPFTGSELALRDEVCDLDILVAGPPCQGHSDLNNVTRRNDPRNQLYFKVARATEVLRPRVVIIENVPTVIHDISGVVFNSESFLQELGYNVSTTVVDAEHVGLPQRRKRHVLVAVRDSTVNISESFGELEAPLRTTLSDYLSGIEDEHEMKTGIYYTSSNMSHENRRRVEYLFDHDVYDLPNALRPPCHRNGSHSYKSMYGRLRWDQPAQTITSGFGSMGQGRFVHPTRPRTITPHEAARIQGFPDFFSFETVTKRTVLQEMIGNAVPPVIGARIVFYLLNAGLI